MGKLSIVSAIACKFRSQHFAVAKFDLIDQAKKFEQYLNKFPTEDHVLIKRTLNRSAGITNDQFDDRIAEVQAFLSTSQYNSIRDVLYRQRDIAQWYTIEWGISLRSSIDKSNETNRVTSAIDDIVMHITTI